MITYHHKTSVETAIFYPAQISQHQSKLVLTVSSIVVISFTVSGLYALIQGSGFNSWDIFLYVARFGHVFYCMCIWYYKPWITGISCILFELTKILDVCPVIDISFMKYKLINAKIK